MDIPWKLDQLWKNLAASLMAGSQGLGVFLDSQEMALVHMRKTFSGLQVEHYDQFHFESGQIDALSSTLQQTVSEWGVATCPVCLALSPELGFCRRAVFPRAALENLTQVVAYELDRFLPLPAEQLYYDYLIQEETSTEIHLMLMALPRNRMDECMRLVTEAGLSPVSVQLAPLAACNAFAGLGRSLSGSWLLLHLASGCFELLSLRDGVVRDYYQGRNLGKKEFSKAVMAQIDGLCGGEAKPNILCLYGSGVSKFEVGLFERYDLEIIYPNHFPISGLPPEAGPDAAWPAAGAALSFLGKALLETNLLPQAERAPVKLGSFSTTPILLAVFLGMFILWLGSLLIHTPVELYGLNRQIAKLSPEAKQVERMLEESRSLAGQMESLRKIGNSPDKLKILKDLTRLIPDNTWLLNLRLSKQYVDLDGISQSASDLIPLLDKSGWLNKTEFASPIVTDADKREHFKIKGESKGLEPGS